MSQMNKHILCLLIETNPEDIIFWKRRMVENSINKYPYPWHLPLENFSWRISIKSSESNLWF